MSVRIYEPGGNEVVFAVNDFRELVWRRDGGFDLRDCIAFDQDVCDIGSYEVISFMQEGFASFQKNTALSHWEESSTQAKE